jgi:predicted alpha/beta superfamily hydrolase
MNSNDASPLPDTEVHYLASEHVGDEFKIFVGHPHAMDARPPKVVFMGDPWSDFGTAVGVTRLLNFTGDLPPLLIVAVGYRAVTVEENEAIRGRDFTPTVDLTQSRSESGMVGGASRFLAFLRDELKPWVRERYGVDPDDSAFFGYSLGGLFATYVLLNEPATFPRYGIGSPSLYWDNELMFRQEEEYARTHKDLRARVVFSVGANENTAGDKRWIAQLPPDRRARGETLVADEPPVDTVADVERMVAALRGRAYPGLDIEFAVWPGEYHQTAPPLALSRSLRYLFEAPR